MFILSELLWKKKPVSDWIEIETRLIATDLDKHKFALRLIKTNSKTAQRIFLVVQIESVFDRFKNRKYCIIFQMNIVNKRRFYKKYLANLIVFVARAFVAISEKPMHQRNLREITKTQEYRMTFLSYVLF